MAAAVSCVPIERAIAETEPNDTFATASPIAVGVPGAQRSTLDPAGDVDYYRFAAEAGKTYVLEVLNVGQSLSNGTNLEVFNSSGNWLDEDYYCDNGTGHVCNRLTVRPSITGTLYLAVDGASSNESGAYTVRVLPRYDQGLTRNAGGEPNDVPDLAEQLSVGGSLTRAIYGRNLSFVTVDAEQDYYRFRARAGATYVAEISGVSTSLRPTNLFAYNRSGTLIREHYGCGTGTAGVCNRVKFSVSISGVHFLQVAPGDSDDSGTYTIALRRTA